MNNLTRLKKELQPMVDKGKITAKQYQDKIDSAIKQEGYGYKRESKGKNLALILIGGFFGFLLGKR